MWFMLSHIIFVAQFPIYFTYVYLYSRALRGKKRRENELFYIFKNIRLVVSLCTANDREISVFNTHMRNFFFFHMVGENTREISFLMYTNRFWSCSLIVWLNFWQNFGSHAYSINWLSHLTCSGRFGLPRLQLNDEHWC